jgi:hypothetical protein
MKKNSLSFAPQFTSEQILKFIPLVVAVLIILFLGVQSLQIWRDSIEVQQLKVEQQKIEAKQKSVQECLASGTVTYKTKDGATVTQPDEKWYATCLKDKQIQ